MSKGTADSLIAAGANAKNMGEEAFDKVMKNMDKSEEQVAALMQKIQSNTETSKAFTKKLGELLKSFGL